MFGLGQEPPSPDRVGWWWRLAGPVGHRQGVAPPRSPPLVGHGGHRPGPRVRTVAGRLGHANPAMTLRVYAHAFAAADQAVAVSLGEVLKGSTSV